MPFQDLLCNQVHLSIKLYSVGVQIEEWKQKVSELVNVSVLGVWLSKVHELLSQAIDERVGGLIEYHIRIMYGLSDQIKIQLQFLDRLQHRGVDLCDWDLFDFLI